MFTTDLLSASLSFVKYFGGNTEQCSDLPYLNHWQQWKPGKIPFPWRHLQSTILISQVSTPVWEQFVCTIYVGIRPDPSSSCEGSGYRTSAKLFLYNSLTQYKILTVSVSLLSSCFGLTAWHGAKRFCLTPWDVQSSFSLTAWHVAQQFQSNYLTWSPTVSV